MGAKAKRKVKVQQDMRKKVPRKASRTQSPKSILKGHSKSKRTAKKVAKKPVPRKSKLRPAKKKISEKRKILTKVRSPAKAKAKIRPRSVSAHRVTAVSAVKKRLLTPRPVPKVPQKLTGKRIVRPKAIPKLTSKLKPAEQMKSAALRLGFQKLYPEQVRIISEVLNQNDILVVLPTGFGKSACYQIPSMVFTRPVVLISPLLALLHDQQAKLQARKIPCVRLDSTVRGRAAQETLRLIGSGKARLIMTTPETFCSADMLKALRTSGVSLIAVDEAHCVSEWGHDFRPSYLRIGARIREIGSPPTMALTATATDRVRADIIRALGLENPIFVGSSPHRSNLGFSVALARGDQKLQGLKDLLPGLSYPGIIYCSTTQMVDTIHKSLSSKTSVPVHRYHGKMTPKERSTQQELFMTPGRRSIMVATSAFGLGIDKPDIRFVIHYQFPASLEQYVQEAGRAGRDGALARCVLFYDPSDRQIHEALQQKSRVYPEQLFRVARALSFWAKERKPAPVEGLALSSGQGSRVVQAILPSFEEMGLARTSPDGLVQVLVPAETFEEQARTFARRFDTLRVQDARRLDTLAQYAYTNECRAVFLRRYFGESDSTPCGFCDVCHQQGRISEAQPEVQISLVGEVPVPMPVVRRKSREKVA